MPDPAPPRGVVATVDDLMFFSKIQAACRARNVPVIFVRSANEFFAAVNEKGADLALVDLNFEAAQPLEVVGRLKRDARTRHVRVVGFYSHVDQALADEATGRGADACYPRSRFFDRLPELLGAA